MGTKGPREDLVRGSGPSAESATGAGREVGKKAFGLGKSSRSPWLTREDGGQRAPGGEVHESTDARGVASTGRHVSGPPILSRAEPGQPDWGRADSFLGNSLNRPCVSPAPSATKGSFDTTGSHNGRDSLAPPSKERVTPPASLPEATLPRRVPGPGLPGAATPSLRGFSSGNSPRAAIRGPQGGESTGPPGSPQPLVGAPRSRPRHEISAARSHQRRWRQGPHRRRRPSRRTRVGGRGAEDAGRRTRAAGCSRLPMKGTRAGGHSRRTVRARPS